MAIQRTFLKWAGNKYKLSNEIKRLLPAGKRLIEPFVGSGAIFLNTNYDEYLLADSSKDVINLYNTLKAVGVSFVDYSKRYFTGKYNTCGHYLRLRDKYNRLDFSNTNKKLKAALFLYLNRHSFNGLVRFNSSGMFNVPFGEYKNPYFPETELSAFLTKVYTCKVKFIAQDFTKTLFSAQTGDVIYCDPPYVPLSPTADFTKYSGKNFSWSMQQDLWQLLQTLAEDGISSVLSNHNTAATRGLYKLAEIKKIEVQRFISCKGERRAKVSELLVKLAA